MPVDVRKTTYSDSPNLKAYLRESAVSELASLQEMANKIQPLNKTESLASTGGQQQLPSFTASPEGQSGQLVSPIDQKYGISQGFGNYNPDLYAGKTAGSRHPGLDIATPEGTPVKSPFAGVVKTGESKTFGKFVEIRTQDGRIMRFSHLKSIDDLAMQLGAAGREIQAGQSLGLTGSTGYSTGPHLDIMYQQGGKWTDPLQYEPLKRTLG
jgi:murein DD-endopeptidase MepM/ murein hydrolase activator NlpD